MWTAKYNWEIPSPGTPQSALKKASECKGEEKKKRFKDYETEEGSQVGHRDERGEDSPQSKDIWLREWDPSQCL